MKANSYLGVRVQGGVAVFSMPFHPGWMTLIGASCTMCTEPGNSGQELTASVPMGEDAVVIIKACYRPTECNAIPYDNINAIQITWESGKMIVNLERPFISSRDRILCINPVKNIGNSFGVLSHGQKFIYAPCAKEVDIIGKRVVNNPTLLLRYVVNNASFEDLEAGATLDQRSMIERELARVQAELAIAQEQVIVSLEKTEPSLTGPSVDQIRIGQLEALLEQKKSESILAHSRVNSVYRLAAELESGKWPLCFRSEVAKKINLALNGG